MENQLNKEQQNFLLDLARKAISQHLKTKKTLTIEIKDENLMEKRGAFVTLKLKNELRGCIGYPIPYDPLYKTVIDAAISAASMDYRFKALKVKELPQVKIEISILTLPMPVKNILEIEVGKHGIIITEGKNKGLLLPQVPVEWNWDLETYLRHGSMKAGLEKNAWKKGAKIEIFSAQVFSE